MLSLHDVPGALNHWVTVDEYAAAKREVVFVAPYALKLYTAKAYFTGTAAVTAATLVLYQNTAAIGTATTSGTVAFRTAASMYSGTKDVAAGDILQVDCALTGGTIPSCLVELSFRSG